MLVLLFMTGTVVISSVIYWASKTPENPSMDIRPMITMYQNIGEEFIDENKLLRRKDLK